MEGGGKRKGRRQINEVEMRGNSSCATAGLPNSQPVREGAPFQPEAPGQGCTTGKEPVEASEKELSSC